MGYRGKLVEQERARRLRATGMTLADIAAELGVSKSSVSLWVRDVEFEPRPRQRPMFRSPNRLHLAKLAEIDHCDAEGRAWIGALSEDAFLAAGTALYAGEGGKTSNKVTFANTDPAMIAFFCAWLRRFFDVGEQRIRVRVYLHDGLDLGAAEEFWSEVTGVPRAQFHRAHRPPAKAGIRRTKHIHGCCYVTVSCSQTLRRIMGLVRALLSSDARSGVAQSAARAAVNR